MVIAQSGDVDLMLFAGDLDVPSTFMGGKKDWGVYQNPGASTGWRRTWRRIPGHASHRRGGALGPAEQPEALSRLLIDFQATPDERLRGGGLRARCRIDDGGGSSDLLACRV
jgi:hypothetical protein